MPKSVDLRPEIIRNEQRAAIERDLVRIVDERFQILARVEVLLDCEGHDLRRRVSRPLERSAIQPDTEIVDLPVFNITKSPQNMRRDR